jgi:hypothetical protein
VPDATTAVGGLVLLGLAEVPQVMSAFLPSPTTAYMGGADPVRIAWLRRGEIIGSAVSLSIAGSVSMIAAQDMGNGAWWIFLGAVGILALFLWEYERAIRMGQADNGGQVPAQGY